MGDKCKRITVRVKSNGFLQVKSKPDNNSETRMCLAPNSILYIDPSVYGSGNWRRVTGTELFIDYNRVTLVK